jgi:hypothetical protein
MKAPADGHKLIEYALILSFIVVVAVSVFIGLNNSVPQPQQQTQTIIWHVAAQGMTWDCDRAPEPIFDTDGTRIYPSGQQPLIIHGGYVEQQISQ